VVIPFGINTKVFKPHDQAESRARFGIPHDAIVLAFRWTPYFSVKGSDYIKRALEILKLDKPTYVLLFDAPHTYGLESLEEKYHFVDLGWVEDPYQVALALSAADLFLMPSIAESFGMMAVESMACGTPVIVFEGTSLPSVIDAPHGGIAVPYMDHGALAQAIKSVLNNSALRQSLVENGSRIVQQRYTLDAYVRRHLELYESLLSRPG
jgi:glycosyltransferase involved in cell wall biosynthesis